MTLSNRNNAVDAVKKVLAALPAGVAEVKESEDIYEYQIEVIPKNKRCCWFWMTFSSYGSYGLGFGHGPHFDDLSIEVFPPDDVAQAIVDGRVRETVWLRRGKAARSMGRIALSDGRELSDDSTLTILGLFGSGKPQEVTYAPYVEVTF